jgi:hypothetical protein
MRPSTQILVAHHASMPNILRVLGSHQACPYQSRGTFGKKTKYYAIYRIVCHNRPMHGRSSKPDIAQNALRVIEQAVGAELRPARKIMQFPARKKNPAAVALGKLGGMKGGNARAAKLSPEERKEIAQRAAKARWGKG